jgi:hypothetical protein
VTTWLAFLAGGWVMMVAYEASYVVAGVDEDTFYTWLPTLAMMSVVARQTLLGATVATGVVYLLGGL